MSNRFLNVKFGADTKDFKKGTNEVRAELTELNSAMRKNKREQKELNDEIKRLEKQQKDLKTVMSQVKTPTKEMTDEANRLQKALDEAALKSAKLKTEEQELKGKISATTKELNEQNTAADKNAISMEKVGNAIKKAVTLTATGMAALFTYTAKMAASSDEINTIAKQTGLATDEIQKFMYASELIDVSLDTLTGSMARLIRNMNTAATTGSGTAYDAFVALDVAITDASGTLRNNKDVFYEIIDKLALIGDETQRDAYAMALFGKSAQELNPLILGGTQQLKEFGDELEREGLILDQMQLDKLNEFNDKIDTFKAKFQAKMMSSSVDWVDAFDELLDKSDEIVDMVATLITGFAKVTGFVIDHKEAVMSLVVAYGAYKTVMSVGSLINNVVKATKALTSATQAATTAQYAMNVACNANPYVLLASVLASVIAAFSTLAITSAMTSEEISEYIGICDEINKRFKDTVAKTEGEVAALRQKGEEYEELRKKVNRTAEEEARLVSVANELKNSLEGEIQLIDNVTGSYMALGDQLEKVIDNIINTAKLSAIRTSLEEAYSAIYSITHEMTSEETMNTYANMGLVKKNQDGTYTAVENNSLMSSRYNVDNVDEIVRNYNAHINELNSLNAFITSLTEEYTELSNKLGVSDNYAQEILNLNEKYKLLTDTQKEFNQTQSLSADTLNNLVSMYPSLSGVVNEYIAGLASGEDVINALQVAYESDVRGFENAVKSKMETNTAFYTSLRELNDTYINTLANQYGIDLSNYQNYSEAKLAIQKAFLSASSKNWADYYDAESNTYKITDKDLMQLRKELRASGMSEAEVNKEIEKYKNDYWDTRNAVNAWSSLDEKLDADLVDYAQSYLDKTNSTTQSSNSGSSTSSQKKEPSIYEQASASYSKLINDRIEEIKKLTEAETAGADERIAAINAEIDARKKLSETEDLQKRIDFIKGQLKYSLLDEFERDELQKQLAELEGEQADIKWEEEKRAEIAAIEAEKAASEKLRSDTIADLQNRQNYANTLFTDLQNGYKSVTTIANNNSKIENLNIIEKALTEGQITQIVKNVLGIGEVF